MSHLKRKNNPEDYDEITEEVDLGEITPVDGVPIIEYDMLTPDTAKIITNETSTAHRIDNAYMSGFNEGFIYGKIKILEVAHEILIRAGNSEDDAAAITKVIATHAGILEQYHAWILTHKNNY